MFRGGWCEKRKGEESSDGTLFLARQFAKLVDDGPIVVCILPGVTKKSNRTRWVVRHAHPENPWRWHVG